jgi:hypothetical protein
MNPDPILIRRNTFPTLPRVLLFSASIKSENTKTYSLSYNHMKTQKHLYLIALVA